MKRLILCLLCVLSVQVAFGQTPLAPQNLMVDDGVYGGAHLQWDAASGVTAYNVYKSGDGLTFTKAASIENSEYLDWYTLPGVTYYYFVTASTTEMEGDASDTAAFSTGHHHYPYPGQGVIGGRITNEQTGVPLACAVVRFFKPGELWVEETHTDTSGIYWAALDTGKYLVRADKYGYIGEWYNNTHKIDSATVMNSIEDTLTVANISLTPIPLPTIVTVNGTVIDSATGLPLKNTFVAFIRPHRWLRELERLTGIFGGSPTERFDVAGLGRLHGVIWMGLTDDDGNYSAHLPADVRLILFAFKPGYIPMFYDNKFTPFTADRLQFTDDTSGIDFAMLSNPLAVNAMTGIVADSAGTLVPSYVVLYRKTLTGRIAVRCSMTDSLGGFKFISLVDGIFFVKAFPVDGYAPSWYNAADCGLRNWHFADSVVVTSDVTGINLCVKLSPRLGFGRIAGTILSEHGDLFSVAPHQGVTVYAINSSGGISGYDITEDDGSYSIEDLPVGSYTIVTDMEGYAEANSSVVMLDESNHYVQTDVSLTLAGELTSVLGQSSLPAKYKLYANYPNPFNPVTKIQFDLPQKSEVAVKVYNIVGQRMAVLLDQAMEAGTRDVQWDAAEVGSGIYFVKLVATPVGDSRPPFSAVRKMILMK